MQVSVEGHYNAVKPQVLGEELLGGWTIRTQEQIPTDPHARVLDSGPQVAQAVHWGSNSSFTVPTGALWCLVVITSKTSVGVELVTIGAFSPFSDLGSLACAGFLLRLSNGLFVLLKPFEGIGNVR